MVLVATQVKRRRGTTAENDAFTGAEGEITVDTQKHELRVHDGTTVGGHIIPTKDYGYSKAESDGLLANKANTSLSNITATGKETIAHNAMPSDRYINLTLGASGSQYTAPADGYFAIQMMASDGDQWMSIYRKSGNSFGVKSTADQNYSLRGFIPVQKGQEIVVSYATGVSGQEFRFIYANGAQ